MAKGKHSTALFEVIHRAKRPQVVAQKLRTPNWWFKGNQTARPAAPPVEPALDEPQTPEPPTPQRRVSVGAGRSAVHMAFDRARQEITLRLRYTTAVVAGFGVFAMIAMSYVVGRHLTHGPQAASAGESQHVQQLLSQPAQQNVMDVHPQRGRLADGSHPEPRRPVEQANVSKPRENSRPSLVPEGVETSLPRTVGLQYVIVASYPPSEETAAKEARDFLNANGIPCTLEKVPEFSAHWICLVGTAGFQKLHSNEYEVYVGNIVDLGKDFHTSHFNQFQPTAFKWRGN